MGAALPYHLSLIGLVSGRYSLCTTKLAGERRFIAAVAGRLQSLGALTKGDRRAASGQGHSFARAAALSVSQWVRQLASWSIS